MMELKNLKKSKPVTDEDWALIAKYETVVFLDDEDYYKPVEVIIDGME